MASLRRLNRRLLRWQRYADRVAFNPRIVQPWAWQPPRGFRRAASAVDSERSRRNPYYGYGPCYCLGCIGSGRCEHEDPDDDDLYDAVAPLYDGRPT